MPISVWSGHAQTIRPITAEELPAWFEAFATRVLLLPQRPPCQRRRPPRPHGPGADARGLRGRTVVGTYRSFATRLDGPGAAGGCPRPRSPGSASGRPTGVAGCSTQMITQDLAESADRGDAASILIAAEWPIYGRYGYGPATWQAKWSLRARATGFKPRHRQPRGRRCPHRPPAGPADLRRLRRGPAGRIDRPDHRWDTSSA